jgi:hypothetical protein
MIVSRRIAGLKDLRGNFQLKGRLENETFQVLWIVAPGFGRFEGEDPLPDEAGEVLVHGMHAQA